MAHHFFFWRERENLSPSFWFSIFIHYFFLLQNLVMRILSGIYSFCFHVLNFYKTWETQLQVVGWVIIYWLYDVGMCCLPIVWWQGCRDWWPCEASLHYFRSWPGIEEDNGTPRGGEVQLFRLRKQTHQVMYYEDHVGGWIYDCS